MRFTSSTRSCSPSLSSTSPSPDPADRSFQRSEQAWTLSLLLLTEESSGAPREAVVVFAASTLRTQAANSLAAARQGRLSPEMVASGRRDLLAALTMVPVNAARQQLMAAVALLSLTAAAMGWAPLDSLLGELQEAVAAAADPTAATALGLEVLAALGACATDLQTENLLTPEAFGACANLLSSVAAAAAGALEAGPGGSTRAAVECLTQWTGFGLNMGSLASLGLLQPLVALLGVTDLFPATATLLASVCSQGLSGGGADADAAAADAAAVLDALLPPLAQACEAVQALPADDPDTVARCHAAAELLGSMGEAVAPVLAPNPDADAPHLMLALCLDITKDWPLSAVPLLFPLWNALAEAEPFRTTTLQGVFAKVGVVSCRQLFPFYCSPRSLPLEYPLPK